MISEVCQHGKDSNSLSCPQAPTPFLGVAARGSANALSPPTSSPLTPYRNLVSISKSFYYRERLSLSMLPPPPPPPYGPSQSQPGDSHIQSSDDPFNGWPWRSSPPINSNIAPSLSSNLWNDRMGDPLFTYRQEIASSYQLQPARHDSTINASTGYPIIRNESLDTIEEPTLQPLQNIPETIHAQHSEPGAEPSRPQQQQQQQQHNPQHSQLTETDWRNHRSKIKELYMDQNASLEKTMAIMSRDFGFRPSLVP